ncbi:MAG TPA: GNAT family N-acetyltransferase, partial [Thermomicrobiales bacterium]|nr:GNAT family N-acetyltransferase [Thermomicrobiales bacterium]
AEDIETAFPNADADCVNEVVSHYVDLNAIRASGKTLLDFIGGDRAKKIRRHIRYLQEEHGPLQVQWAESLDEAREIFAEMRLLHQARWQSIGEPGAFASSRFNSFHEDIVERLFPRGHVGLVRVRAGDITLGCDYTLIEHNRMLGYQWGLGTLTDKRVSVGIITAAAVMQAALERGIDEYDHLAGDALHKRTLATTSRDLAWARIPSGTRIQIIYKLAEARRRTRALRLFRPPNSAQN